MKICKTAISAACACAVSISALTISSNASAANWTILQGTEPTSAAGRAKVWGFVDSVYEKDTSDANQYVGTPGNNYEYVPPKMLGPDLNSQEGFNIRRARVGVRGQGFPLDGKVNYFVLAEFGNNGVTHGTNSAARLTDASITVNPLQYFRIRTGAFKVPTFEEGYQAIHVFDYINFTEVANQLMLERYPNDQYKPNRNNSSGFQYTDTNQDTPFNQFDKPVGAFRDVGIQFFGDIQTGTWEHTYAVMLGNGNGVNYSDNDDNKDVYAYWSTEKVFAGKGPLRQGLKMFIWAQSGKRSLHNPDTPAANDSEPAGLTEYDRKRSGLGVKYLKGNFRATAEYLQGEGMIFLGPDNPTFTITAPGATGGPRPLLADGRKGEADGYYIEGGWKIFNSGFELDARYDVYNRLTDAEQMAGPCRFEFTFTTITLGAQYHINKKTRLTLNAADRNFEAADCPAPGPGGNPNNNLDGVGQRYSLQLRHIF